jgi:PHD/YefM family antitoxin component YafN of YafNO toxin-antitoxin module
MEHVNAVDLRQSVRRIVERLERSGEPIILERGGKPVAAIISLKDFQERFAERAALEERDRILEEMDRLARPSADRTPAVQVLRELRGKT